MSTNRYVVPIPESMRVLKTRQELNELAREYLLGGLDQQNGGYCLIDGDKNVVAVASDSLCDELDVTIAEIEQHYKDLPELDEENDTTSCS
jgi:hypothetical protein